MGIPRNEVAFWADGGLGADKRGRHAGKGGEAGDGVRHPQPHRLFRRDVHVYQPRDPHLPKKRPHSAGFPYYAGADSGLCVDGLEREDQNALVYHRVFTDEAVIAKDSTLLYPHTRLYIAVSTHHRAPDVTGRPDVSVVHYHDAVYEVLAFYDHVVADYGVFPDLAPGLHLHVIAEEDGTLDLHAIVDFYPVPEPDVVLESMSGNLNVHKAIQDVPVYGQVLFEVSDVAPVALGHISVKRHSILEELREKVLRAVV